MRPQRALDTHLLCGDKRGPTGALRPCCNSSYKTTKVIFS